MMNNKLELRWCGKDEPINIEPRLLIENRKLSNTANDPDTENMLIHGDNLLALKALENKYSGKVKCIYIDPPYNTGSAFEHYDDNLEHSIWLNLMYARLQILKTLLSEDGFLCCQIDDSESAYLKIILDEIFGRNNYLTTLYVQVRYPDKTLKKDMDFHKEIEQIHIYRNSPKAHPILDEIDIRYDKFNYRVDIFGEPEKVLELGGKKVEIYSKDTYNIVEEKQGTEYGLKEIWASGTILDGNSSGRFFRDYLSGRVNSDGLGVLYKVYGIGDDRYDFRYFTGPKKEGATKGKYYQGVPVSILSGKTLTSKIPINGFYDYAAYFGNCRHEGGVGFRGGKKPEIVLQTILSHFSKEGDLVLDSFLGSGTTMAVAHKMHRNWIGIEMGDQAYTLCKNRIDNVINGDKTGSSKDLRWNGGGAYRFYELSPSLINCDSFGEYIINKEYNPEMLAATVALHEGFTYNPDDTIFWKQSIGNEKSYLFVTTRHLNHTFYESIKQTMRDDEHLIIACRSYEKELEKSSSNITIKKIPQLLLSKCDFGKTDYNLNIINPPEYDYYDEEEND